MSEKKEKYVASTEIDVLDQIKNIEKVVKANLLIKSIKELKRMARKINEIKEESVIMLKEIGLSEKDIKRVLDFINETSEVKLTDSDHSALLSKVKKQNQERKTMIEDSLEGKYGEQTITNLDSGTVYTHTSQGLANDPNFVWYNYPATCQYTESFETIMLSDDGSTLELKM